jgi:hypothetical protein
VVFDWLEDCLVGPLGKKRRRVEKGYSLDRTIKRLEKGKSDHAEFRNKFEDGLVSVSCWFIFPMLRGCSRSESRMLKDLLEDK